ncbi:hypothetical protein LTR85_003468 [Meristemomyces frigidus]|nr:hypothetical protein LTR85_003468 [Meristemomyces frigidus]
MSKSRLLNLPLELRNRIYHFALQAIEAVKLADPPLTKISRQVREESLLMYYAENGEFELEIRTRDADALAAQAFALQSYGGHKLTLVCKLRVACYANDLQEEYYVETNMRRWRPLLAAPAGLGFGKDQVWWTVMTPNGCISATTLNMENGYRGVWFDDDIMIMSLWSRLCPRSHCWQRTWKKSGSVS